MKKPLVIILAGGIGKNFQPITVNKTLIPLHGKPLLQHTIEMVEQNGFSNALIVTNPENEQWLSTYQPFNITLQTHLQSKPDGIASALLEIEQEIGNQPILIMNAVDAIEPTFMKQIYRMTLDSYAFVTSLKTPHDQHHHAGYLRTEGSKALEIVEKPTHEEKPSNLVNIVFHYFSEPHELLSLLHQSTSAVDDIYERALSKYMQMKEVQVLEYNGYWQKLKHSHQILDMMQTFLKHRVKSHVARSARVSPHAVIEGDVFIDDDAHIDAFAVVKGPAYIGRRAKVGNHALVRQSMVEEDAVVGFGSEVARSYIGPRCMLHQNFVGDSILESDINPSWGTTTGNMRIDNQTISVKLPDSMMQTYKNKLGAIIAKGAFFGINCSIMPGVTVGKNARIYPNKVLFAAVKDEEIVK